MTPLDLQDSLAEEIKAMFDGQMFPCSKKNTDDTEDTEPLNVYRQALPVKDGTDFTSYIPYIVVQLSSGEQESEEEATDVTAILNIGIKANGDDNQGHVFVLNIIETIRNHFFAFRMLGCGYFMTLPFKWKINDEDVYPYFFGSIETHWSLPVIESEDPLL